MDLHMPDLRIYSAYLVGSGLRGNESVKRNQQDHDGDASQNGRTKVLVKEAGTEKKNVQETKVKLRSN